MNQGQEMFYHFFLERVMDDRKEEAKSLLEECFSRQNAGAFDRSYFEEVMPKFFAIVKPENLDELKAAMNHFGSGL